MLESMFCCYSYSVKMKEHKKTYNIAYKTNCIIHFEHDRILLIGYLRFNNKLFKW